LGHSAENQEVDDILQDIIEDDTRAGVIIDKVRRLIKKEQVEKQSLDMNEVGVTISGLVQTEFVVRADICRDTARTGPSPRDR